MQFSCRPISLAAHAEKRVLQVGNTHKCVCKHDIYYYRFMCVRIFTSDFWLSDCAAEKQITLEIHLNKLREQTGFPQTAVNTRQSQQQHKKKAARWTRVMETEDEEEKQQHQSQQQQQQQREA